jgi:hypothetical protein
MQIPVLSSARISSFAFSKRRIKNMIWIVGVPEREVRKKGKMIIGMPYNSG